MKRCWAILICVLMLLAGPAAAQTDVAHEPPSSGEVRKLTEGWRLFQGDIVAPLEATRAQAQAKPVSLPHIWPDDYSQGRHGTYGVGTYVLHVKVDGPASAFSLRTGKQRAVYRFFAVAQGESGAPRVYDLGGNGTPGQAAEDDAAGRLFQVQLPFDEAEFDLVVQVSNHIYQHAGFLWAPSIGPVHAMEQAHDQRIAISFLIVGLFLAFGLLTMLLAAWHAGGHYYHIGGWLLIVMAVRTLMVDNYIWVIWPSLPMSYALRVEYIGLFLLAPSYYWLVTELFPKEGMKTVAGFLGIFCGLATLVALFAPLPTMFRLRDPYIGMSLAVLALIVWVIYRARKNGRAGATWALWGAGLSGLGAALDTYLYLPGPRTSVEAVPFTALIFTFVLLGLFTVRYRQEQEERAFLSDCLERANKELQERAQKLDVAQAEAAAALDLKNSFLSNLSNEIQTPLRTIVSFADRLTDTGKAGLGVDERTDYLRMIRSNSANLSKLMEDVLSVADLETGRFEVSPEPLDPKDIADDVLTFVESVAHEKHILIDLKCERAPMAIDRRLMRQALIKIVSNAVKFSPVNGVVTIRGSKAGSDFVFTVMDTGPGMEASEIPVAISLLGSAGKSKGQGFGLGLPLVARFMELIGGSMQIDSIPNLGTTVTLSFPMTPPQSASPDED